VSTESWELHIATLVVRVGMASNALAVQMQAGVDAGQRPPAFRNRDVLCSLVASAALTNEAIKLASEGMATFHELLPRSVNTDAKRVHVACLAKRMGKLCSGKHPADAFLKRARNELCFHWDAALVGRAVRDFGKNEKIIWLESDVHAKPLHRLASDVLAHALYPEMMGVTNEAEAERATREIFENVNDAMNTIIEFFTAAIYGYMASVGVVRRGSYRLMASAPRARGLLLVPTRSA
jgi:hypothetical protein